MANIVINFADNYFVNQPVQGLDGAREGFFKTIKLRENSVNLRRANTTVGGVSFSLVDNGGFITGLLADNPNYFLNYPVAVWVGRDEEAFSELFRLPAAYITSVQHDSSQYNFSASDVLFLLNKSVNEISTRLTSGFTVDSTVVEAITENPDMGDQVLTEDFPASGFLKIGDEFLSYNGKTPTAFNISARGLFGSEKGTGDTGDEILLVTRATGNPMTVLLSLLGSRSGDGSQNDIYRHGLGIPSQSLSVETFTELADGFFAGDTVDLLIFQDEDFLKLLQNEILQLTNCRFIQDGDKIGVNLLDESDPLGEGDFVVDDTTISKYKNTKVDYSNILNRIRVEYGYSAGSDTFKRIRFFRNEESIKLFGESKEVVYEFRGVPATSTGDDMVQAMAERYFARFSTPNPQISIETNFETFSTLPGHTVFVDSDIIPSASGFLGFHNILEVIKKSVDAVKGKIGLTLAFTSYSGGRAGIPRISPVAVIQNITMDVNGFVFHVNDTALFRPGFVVRRFFKNSTRYGNDDDFYGVSPYFNVESGGTPTYGGLRYDDMAVYGTVPYDSGNYGGIVETDGNLHVIRTVDHNEGTITFFDVVHASPGQLFEFADYPDVEAPAQTSRFAYIESEREYLIG